jgi:hypothetical protein
MANKNYLNTRQNGVAPPGIFWKDAFIVAIAHFVSLRCQTVLQFKLQLVEIGVEMRLDGPRERKKHNKTKLITCTR